MGLYSFYESRVFPHLMETMMKSLGDLRAEALSQAEGDILEIGFGTGLNLPHYPPAVKSLHALDPMTALEEKVQGRIDQAPFPVTRHALPADGVLPFTDAQFDTVTITWTLCTIPDPDTALREMRRILKPGGRMLFLEHGRSDKPSVAKWQDRFNPVQNVVGCGCNVNRKMDALIENAGFRMEQLDRFLAEGAPEIFGTMYRGAARHG